MCSPAHMNSRWSQGYSHKGGIGALTGTEVPSLRKIVAANDVVLCRSELWNDRSRFTGNTAPATRLDKGTQDCQRQYLVSSICTIVEFRRQIWLPRQRTEPIAALVDKAPQLPCRQFQFDQGQRGVCPCP